MAEVLGLTGRESELEQLRAAFREIATELTETRLVVVTGVSGIGKTSLCAAVASEFEAEGALVLGGTCPRPWGASLAYAPFVAAWALKPGDDGEGEGRQPPEGERAYEREEGFAGWLGKMSRLGGDAPEVGQAWLCERVLGQLRQWGRHQPVVLVLEDAHWIDTGSMSLLQVIATTRMRGRLLVVVTARTEAPDGGAVPALLELATRPRARLLELGPLHDEVVREIVRDLDDDAAVEVVGRAAGHPLFAVELLRHRGPGLPNTLQVLLGRRIRELGPEGARLLAAVTIAGDRACEPVLAEMLGVATVSGLVEEGIRQGLLTRALNPDRPTRRRRHDLPGTAGRLKRDDPAGGDDGLRWVVAGGGRDGLGVAAGGGDGLRAGGGRDGLRAGGGCDGLAATAGRLRVLHPLFGEVAVADTVPAEKTRWHTWLAERAEGSAAAWHWERAGEAERAAECWYAGGVAATARHAHGEAAYAYQRALELRETPRLYSALANALRWSGRPKEAAVVLRRALAVAPPNDSAARCEILCQLWDCRFVSGAREEAYETLAEATALAAGLPDSPLTARLAAAEASTLMTQGRYAEGVARSRIAQRHAERVSDLATQAHALSTLGVCLAFSSESGPAMAEDGNSDRANARGSDAASESDFGKANVRGSDAAGEGDIAAANARGSGAAGEGDADAADSCDFDTGNARHSGEAIEALEAARNLAHRLGSVRELTRAAGNLTFVLANTGAHERAVTIGREALSRLDSLGLAGALGGPLHFNVAVSLLALGRWDELCELANRIDDRLPPAKAARMRLCLAEVTALRGDQAETARLLAEADGIIDGPDELYDAEKAIPLAISSRTARRPRTAIEVCRTALRTKTAALGPIERLRLCAEALGALNELQTARGRVTRIDNPEDVIAEFRPAATLTPSTLEERALVLLCEAEVTRDPKLWAETADAWDGLKMVHHAAYARMRQAEALIASRDPAAAGVPLRQAFSTAVALAVTPLREDVERVARQGRIPLLSDRPDTSDRPHLAVLTRREREVLELVGRGRTNREIATTLVLSERTVGVHVSRILAKLGATNRSEAIHLAISRQ